MTPGGKRQGIGAERRELPREQIFTDCKILHLFRRLMMIISATEWIVRTNRFRTLAKAQFSESSHEINMSTAMNI